MMKNSWFITVVGVGFVLTVVIALNYSAKKKATPLSEIFPEEEESAPAGLEYEFVDIKSNKIPEAADVQQKLDSAKPVMKPTPAFTIQIASFKDRTKAEKALEDLKKKGYPAGLIVTKDLGEGNLRHRLYAGEFATNVQAEEFLVNVRKDYPDSFIIQLTK